MTTWTLCLLALGIINGVLGEPSLAWYRTWGAMLAASIAGKVFNDPTAWVLIDLAAAFVVIFPPRIGFQKAIAALFGGMMVFELGWILSARMNVEVVINAGSLGGWLQIAVLLAWGIDDRYGISRVRDWVIGPRLAGARVNAK